MAVAVRLFIWTETNNSAYKHQTNINKRWKKQNYTCISHTALRLRHIGAASQAGGKRLNKHLF